MIKRFKEETHTFIESIKQKTLMKRKRMEFKKITTD